MEIFLFAKGLLLSIDNEDFDLLKLISIAVREISEGELLQIEKARKVDITEDVYYEIIRQKTATLIAACAALVLPLWEQIKKLFSRCVSLVSILEWHFKLKMICLTIRMKK